MRIRFPFFLGSATPAVAEVVVVAPPWSALAVAAQSWALAEGAPIIPRFNRLYQQEAGAPQFVRTDDAVN